MQNVVKITPSGVFIFILFSDLLICLRSPGGSSAVLSFPTQDLISGRKDLEKTDV
jgi:hypothetical protein